MNLLNCKRCGKMYQYNGKPICAECVKKEDEDFEVARAYIKDNPGCNMQTVADETGISLKLLTKFLKEKRIEFSDGSTGYISCEKCGTPISAGRYCNNCLTKLGKEMMKGAPPSKSSAPLPTSDASKREGGFLSKK